MRSISCLALINLDLLRRGCRWALVGRGLCWVSQCSFSFLFNSASLISSPGSDHISKSGIELLHQNNQGLYICLFPDWDRVSAELPDRVSPCSVRSDRLHHYHLITCLSNNALVSFVLFLSAVDSCSEKCDIIKVYHEVTQPSAFVLVSRGPFGTNRSQIRVGPSWRLLRLNGSKIPAAGSKSLVERLKAEACFLTEHQWLFWCI